jgi:hypothetical protein
LEDIGIDGRIILKWILNRIGGGYGLDSAGCYRDMWWAVVNSVVNLRIT